jgi:hypothetical protein
MPTFGDTTVRTVGLLVSAGNQMVGTPGTPASAGNGTSISFYGNRYGDTNIYFKGVLVKASDKTIVTNGITDPFFVNSAIPQWWTATFPIAPAIEKDTAYYVCIIASNNIVVNIDTGGIGQYFGDSSNSYASPTNPTDGSLLDYYCSVYCTYALAVTTIKGIQTIKNIQSITF